MLRPMPLDILDVNGAQSYSGDQKGFTVEVPEKQVLKEVRGVPAGRLWLGVQGGEDSMCDSLEDRTSRLLLETTQFGLACIFLVSLVVP